MVAAIFIGGSFIFATFAWYWMAVASGLLGVAAILAWLWVGTAEIPEKAEKAVGLGLTLPLYASGPAGVGRWAMFITLLGGAKIGRASCRGSVWPYVSSSVGAVSINKNTHAKYKTYQSLTPPFHVPKKS